eukprot:2724845-Pleurochrysis_carterae.AAC.1
MEGTQRTSVRDKRIRWPRESRAVIGMSPIATHGRGLPSTPVTVSAHGRAFTKSRPVRVGRCVELLEWRVAHGGAMRRADVWLEHHRWRTS